MFIIKLFLTLFRFYKFALVFIPEQNAGFFAFTFRFLKLHIHVFISGSMLENNCYKRSSQTQVTGVSIVLKDSDMESEKLSLLIRISVLDYHL